MFDRRQFFNQLRHAAGRGGPGGPFPVSPAAAGMVPQGVPSWLSRFVPPGMQQQAAPLPAPGGPSMGMAPPGVPGLPPVVPRTSTALANAVASQQQGAAPVNPAVPEALPPSPAAVPLVQQAAALPVNVQASQGLGGLATPPPMDWGAFYDAKAAEAAALGTPYSQYPTDPAAAAAHRAAFIASQQPAAAAAQAAANTQTIAYQQARDYAVGVRPDMSTGGPLAPDDAAARATRMNGSSEALAQFNASGYDGQRALADGWGNGQGATGWLPQSTAPAAPMPASPTAAPAPSGYLPPDPQAPAPPSSSPGASAAPATPPAPAPRMKPMGAYMTGLNGAARGGGLGY